MGAPQLTFLSDGWTSKVSSAVPRPEYSQKLKMDFASNCWRRGGREGNHLHICNFKSISANFGIIKVQILSPISISRKYEIIFYYVNDMMQNTKYSCVLCFSHLPETRDTRKYLIHWILCFFLKFWTLFFCSVGVLPAWCVYTHWHRGKTEKGQSPEYFKIFGKKHKN